MRSLLYRWAMQLAHFYHWHYAPPIYPNGDTVLWCRWCGFRQMIHEHDDNASFKKLVESHGSLGRETRK